MTVANAILSFAGVLLATTAGGVFVLLAIANLWASDEACQPAPDPDPKKKKPEPAAAPAAAPGRVSNPADPDVPPDVGYRWPGYGTETLSTREQPAREYWPAGYWHSDGFVFGSTATRPSWLKRMVWRLVFGLRWNAFSFPHP
jgi:hypothetical protein